MLLIQTQFSVLILIIKQLWSSYPKLEKNITVTICSHVNVLSLTSAETSEQDKAFTVLNKVDT